jgi:hypothetical protein
MPDLSFRIESASVVPFAAVPMIAFQLQIKNAVPDETIYTIALRCQIQIEVTRRRYAPGEQARLLDLFGHPDRWSQTLRSLLWTHASVVVPAFTGTTTVVDLQVPCSFDFNVAATKYFYGLESGDVPLTLLFSGTVFYRDAEDVLQMDQISWSKQAEYRLPVRIWRELMDHYYPNSTWLRIDHEVFDQIYQYKRQNGFTSWDETLRSLLRLQRKEGWS